mgnify:CR=1 FL=1
MRPSAKHGTFRLEPWVLNGTRKALDGLYFMIGEEEKKIRKNPAARVTSILKDVFGIRR